MANDYYVMIAKMLWYNDRPNKNWIYYKPRGIWKYNVPYNGYTLYWNSGDDSNEFELVAQKDNIEIKINGRVTSRPGYIKTLANLLEKIDG